MRCALAVTILLLVVGAGASWGYDARGRAILAGMGHCRRLVVAHRLAAALHEPMTFSLIAGHRSSASPELLRILDHLAQRIESNPVARFSTPSVASVP